MMTTMSHKYDAAGGISRSNGTMEEHRASIFPASFTTISPLSQAGSRLSANLWLQQQSRPLPPPQLTQKLLEMMDSGPRGGTHREGRPPIPSTEDSPTQAMKHDLEELIAFVDGLAFEGTPGGTDAISISGSANPSRPPGRGTTVNNAQGIFRDRTNHRPAATPVSSTPMKKLFEGAGGPSRPGAYAGADGVTSGRQRRARDYEHIPPMESFVTPKNRASQSASLDVSDDATEDEPATRPLEPAGSVPDREASLYFHDQSLSLILSQSDEDADADEGVFDQGRTTHEDGSHSSFHGSTAAFVEPLHQPANATNPNEAFRATSSATRLMATVQEMEIGSGSSRTDAPASVYDRESNEGTGTDEAIERTDPDGTKRAGASKTISFLPVAIDPTPTKLDDRTSLDHRVAMVTSLPNRDRASSSIPTADVRNDVTTRAPGWDWSSVPRTPYPPRNRRQNSSHEGEGHNISNDEIDSEPSFTPQTWRQSDPLLHHRELLSNSPESAKKLLQTAVEALKDARREREAAREWANAMQESVHQWVEEQRQLIRTESLGAAASTTDASTQAMTVVQQQLEHSIRSLHQEISQSNSSRSMLHGLLMKQDDQIRSMSCQLSAMKRQLESILVSTPTKQKLESIVERRSTNQGKDRMMPNEAQEAKSYFVAPANGDGISGIKSRAQTVPSFILKTSKKSSSQRHIQGTSSHWSLASTSSHQTGSSSRIRRNCPNGAHMVDYGNGVTKEVHADGTTVTRFPNGDVETKFCDANPPDKNDDMYNSGGGNKKFGIVAYFHCREGVLQVTQKDGSILYEYSNGQVERHYGDGTKVILYPDGTKKIVVREESRRVD